MSYLSRLIADTPAPRRGATALPPPARLDVDVLRDVSASPAAMRMAASAQPAAVAPAESRVQPIDRTSHDATPPEPISIHRDVVMSESPSVRHDAWRDAPSLPRPVGEPSTTADPSAPRTSPIDVPRDVSGSVDPEPIRASQSKPTDRADMSPDDTTIDGAAIVAGNVGHAEVEIATRVIASSPLDDRAAPVPPDDPASEPQPGVPQIADRAQLLTDPVELSLAGSTTERPELQQVSLSIGTIEVVVDAPSGPPALVASLPPVDAPHDRLASDDPILRLRRQYVTWPEGR